MSENEQSGHDHGIEQRPERAAVNVGHASEWDQPPVPWRVAEPGEGPTHRGHVEHPVQMYAIMKPVPNSLPEPADAEAWISSFARAAEQATEVIAERFGVPAENVSITLDPSPTRGGTDKTTARVDFDPQGNLTRWDLGSEPVRSPSSCDHEQTDGAC